MSGIRDGLSAWAAPHGDVVAMQLTGKEAEATTRRRVARQRRARVVGIGAAAVAVVVVAALVIPTGDRTYTTTPGVFPTSEPAATLAAGGVPDALSCGTPWSLEQGLAQHAEGQPGTVTGEWTVTEDGGAVHENPTSLWAGYEVLTWSQKSRNAMPDEGVMLSTIVTVAEGEIVGVAPVTRADDAQGASEFEIYAPLPGVCGTTDVGAHDGAYTYHVVTQLQTADGEPIATWVDPGEAVTLGVKGLDDWFASALGTEPSSPLVAADSDTYQAFLIAAPLPKSSCEPYTDILANGEPANSTPVYHVTIPGVQTLTSGMWAGSPVASIDGTTLDAWYVNLPTGVISEQFGGGNPLGSLTWTTKAAVGETVPPGNLRLVTTGDDAPLVDLPEECVFPLPGPTPSGAVFLVIDGVDLEALGEENPGADFANLDDFQTWVYLGQVS